MYRMDDDPLQATISKNVKLLMALRDMATQQQLCRAIGIDKGELSRRFSGRQRWQVRDLGHLAKALGVQPGDLLREPAELVAAAVDTPASAADHADIRGDKGLYRDVYHKVQPLSRGASPLVRARERWGLAANQVTAYRPAG